MRRWLRAVRTIALPRLGRDGVSAALGAAGRLLLRARPERRSIAAQRARLRPHEGDRWFTPDEAALVEALASRVVPSGEEIPGARELEILGEPVVRQIEHLIAARGTGREAYAWGLIAIDERARARHGHPFVELDVPQQDELLSALEAGSMARSDGSRGGLARRITHAFGMWNGNSAAVELYDLVVADTMKAFYTSELAWLWLEYDGPPMPLGYEDPAVPRERRRVVPLTPTPVAPRPAATPRSDSADVVVIGTGAGGAVVAKELAEAGLSVIVLEAGRRYAPLADYPSDRTDFELHAKEVFRAADPRRDAYTTMPGRTFSYSRVKGVGGSTLHYVGMAPRLHESDFATRSRDGVGQDWPITYADLEPYYARVEAELGVSGADGANPFEPPRSTPYPTPPHPFNLASRTIKRGADQLGLHLVREPLAMPSVDWHGRSACVGAGTCHMGCMISAKSSMDVTYVRKAEATGRVDLRTESMAREIELDRRGRARAVVYIDADGREQRVSGRAIVVAGNAVETPRLLLMSSSSRFPDGLANSSGLVGRNFMEHLAVFAFGLFDDRVDPWRGTPSGGFIQDTYETDPRNDFARGWTTLVSANSHWPATVASRIPGWGQAHKDRMERLFGRSISLATVGEQLPDPRNRVILDPIEKDSHGLPVPCIIHGPGENDRAMIRKITASVTELLEASGASEVWGAAYEPGGSSHYMGTCRMGNDPATSVVNALGRTHDVPNLYLADSSVLVTVGAANPSLTISALALRTAEGIIDDLRRHAG